MAQRWKRRPEGSNWGEFGPDDEIGRLNLLTPDKVKQGVAEVREGKTFCLTLPLDFPGGNVLSPHRHPPVLRPVLQNGRARMNLQSSLEIPGAREVVCDDIVIMHTQYSSQWDAFAHAGYMFDADGDGVDEPVYYNGYRAGDDIVGPDDARDAGGLGATVYSSTCVARALGIEKMAESCVQGRGVMVDLHAHYGMTYKSVGYDDLMRVMDADKVVVEKGDMLCLHTGIAQLLLEMDRKPDREKIMHGGAGLDGNDRKLLQWITDSGLAVIMADNVAVEHVDLTKVAGRTEPFCVAPLHEHCLFKLGIHLGELWHLTPLANWLRAHGRNRFLLTAPPLRLPGAVGSPATPVATV